MDRVKRIWYLSPMRAAKVQASLRIRAVSPEPSLLAHISSESRGTFRQKARSLAPLNGWACAVKVCHDGMLEDTNSLGGAHIIFLLLGENPGHSMLNPTNPYHVGYDQRDDLRLGENNKLHNDAKLTGTYLVKQVRVLAFYEGRPVVYGFIGRKLIMRRMQIDDSTYSCNMPLFANC